MGTCGVIGPQDPTHYDTGRPETYPSRARRTANAPIHAKVSTQIAVTMPPTAQARTNPTVISLSPLRGPPCKQQAIYLWITDL